MGCFVQVEASSTNNGYCEKHVRSAINRVPPPRGATGPQTNTVSAQPAITTGISMSEVKTLLNEMSNCNPRDAQMFGHMVRLLDTNQSGYQHISDRLENLKQEIVQEIRKEIKVPSQKSQTEKKNVEISDYQSSDDDKDGDNDDQDNNNDNDLAQHTTPNPSSTLPVTLKQKLHRQIHNRRSASLRASSQSKKTYRKMTKNIKRFLTEHPDGRARARC